MPTTLAAFLVLAFIFGWGALGVLAGLLHGGDRPPRGARVVRAIEPAPGVVTWVDPGEWIVPDPELPGRYLVMREDRRHGTDGDGEDDSDDDGDSDGPRWW